LIQSSESSESAPFPRHVSVSNWLRRPISPRELDAEIHAHAAEPLIGSSDIRRGAAERFHDDADKVLSANVETGVPAVQFSAVFLFAPRISFAYP